jgi:hypothetical protein
MRYKTLQKISDYFNKKAKDQFAKEYGMNHACYRCGKWESEGNKILTTVSERDGHLDHRHCENCGYEWDAIFTPAGFIKVDAREQTVEEE